MVRILLSVSNEELLQLVRSWLDVLATEDYERVFRELGYAMAWGEGACSIQRDIDKYRSPTLYPGMSRFRVSDWRTASGGNKEPLALVRRYKYVESLPIVATIELHLPLNGRWSDLEADFVVTASGPDVNEGVLALEHISCPWSEDGEFEGDASVDPLKS